MKEIEKHWTAGSYAEVGNCFGVSPETVRRWAKIGMPGEVKAWPLGKIAQWLRTSGPWSPKLPPDDVLMVGGDDSPALERFRLARAKIVELDLQEREGKLLSLEKMRAVHTLMAAVNRRTGKRLERKFGRQAINIFNSGFESAKREADRLFGESEE